MEVQQLNVELNWVHRGQKHAYGDSHYICEIHTQDIIPEKDLLLLVGNTRLPYNVWKERINSAAEYFKGYYTLEKTTYGYLYHGVYPYDD